MTIKFKMDSYKECITESVVASYISPMINDVTTFYVDFHDSESPLSYYRLRVINTPAGMQVRVSICGARGDSTYGYYHPQDVAGVTTALHSLMSNSLESIIHGALIKLRRKLGKPDLPDIQISVKKYEDNPHVFNPYV